MEEALRVWLAREEGRHPNLLRLGFFGSYARGDWGVGSDLDLIALVREADEPFERRALCWDLNPLPVPTELLVYTEAEWRRLLDARSRFAETVMQQAVWVYLSPQGATASCRPRKGLRAARFCSLSLWYVVSLDQNIRSNNGEVGPRIKDDGNQERGCVIRGFKEKIDNDNGSRDHRSLGP